jgi:hypothetical protein
MDFTKNKAFIIFTILFIIFNALDYLTTIYCLQNGGSEANPIMAFVTTNPLLFLVSKCIGVVLVIALVSSILSNTKFTTDHPLFIKTALGIILLLPLSAFINNGCLILMSGVLS